MSDLQFHLDRLDAWLTELWTVKSIDLHMCNPKEPTRRDQRGLLTDIRDDVRVLRREYHNLKAEE